jgi:hypothetical protein
MLIQPAGEHTSLSMGKWYFRGNAHALNNPNLRKNSKTTVPKIQTVKLPEKKIKIKNPKTFEKKCQDRAEPAWRDRTKNTKQPKIPQNPFSPPDQLAALMANFSTMALGANP